MYNPAANYYYPATYTDGTPVFDTDFGPDQNFPDEANGDDSQNWINRFPAAFCPTFKYQANNVTSLSKCKTEADENLQLPVACLGKKNHFLNFCDI